MSLQKKPKATPQPAAQPSKASNTDELDAIMNEIADLQNEMAEATAKPQPQQSPKTALKMIPGGANNRKLSSADQVAAEVEAAQEESILAEFQSGASDEHSLEGTLSDLGEEPSAGNSILDQVETDSEPEMTETTSTEDTIEELGGEPSMDVAPEPDFDGEAISGQPEEEVPVEASSETEPDADEFSAEELENAILESSENSETQSPEEEEETMAPVHKTVSGQNAGSEGTLSMTLTGNMTLNIKYETGGQQVSVSFTDGFLKVQLADGTEFKIPVSRANAAVKRAA